ncbi:DUF6585 family protein [Streptomyces sp. HD]|uniref:DUF6585 family protein n=1 Tax=Streptomyces sp. HD TaxID=3020892 RepID=UPI00232F00AA|nr:DUF6585 family protein [Streptomyces sp. HD]MDC0769254.1 hypothetical protein [Streptomyces sp. HD]
MNEGTARDRAADHGDDRAGDGADGRNGTHADARANELLLARVSEAAGRARLGRRRATYRAPVAEAGIWRAGVAGTRRAGAAGVLRAAVDGVLRAAVDGVSRAAAAGVARRLLRAGGGRGAKGGARLDLYEYGLTATIEHRIHVVRYDTTVVRRRRVLSPQGLTRAHVLVDVAGERIVLRSGDFGRPEVWGREIHRAVAEAQVPEALDALAEGARLVFGPVWITGKEIGSRGTSLRWAQIQRIEILNGSVAVRAADRWQVWGTVASGIPNLCVLHTLAECLTAAEQDED